MTGCLFKLASLESQVPGGLTATIREAAFQLLVRSPLEFAFDRAPRALLPVLATRGDHDDHGWQ